MYVHVPKLCSWSGYVPAHKPFLNFNTLNSEVTEIQTHVYDISDCEHHHK
jgi:hypothetical protein